MSIYKWLFEKVDSSYKPQLAWATANKQGLLWLPGNKWVGSEEVDRRIRAASIMGCTQLAFKSYTQPQTDQNGCYIAWIGLDLDEGPLNPETIADCAQIFNGSIRASCGGKGRHLLFRLSTPVFTNYSQANLVVRLLTKPMVDWLEARGQPVCKADKRVFYLEGGRNAWIHQTQSFHSSTVNVTAELACEQERVNELARTSNLFSYEKLADSVKQWIGQFQRAGCLPQRIQQHMPLNIRRLVRLLRANGEIIETKSGLSTDTGVNGYLDIGPTHIKLWAFADGRDIWRWVDV